MHEDDFRYIREMRKKHQKNTHTLKMAIDERTGETRRCESLRVIHIPQQLRGIPLLTLVHAVCTRSFVVPVFTAPHLANYYRAVSECSDSHLKGTGNETVRQQQQRQRNGYMQ